VVKIYTRTGDAGQTSLLSGGRVGKDHGRIEAYGTLDEVSAVLGLLYSEPLPADAVERLQTVQESLLAIGAVLADAEGRFEADEAAWDPAPLEGWIDAMDAGLPPLKAFILPGGCRGAALAHVARTVCRRAERRVKTLSDRSETVPPGVLPYLNRLSDALFVLARHLNARLGISDPEWRPRGTVNPTKLG
jgi:cob(I)alamin adenosyltransferase